VLFLDLVLRLLVSFITTGMNACNAFHRILFGFAVFLTD